MAGTRASRGDPAKGGTVRGLASSIPRHRRAAVGLTLVSLALLLAACSSDGPAAAPSTGGASAAPVATEGSTLAIVRQRGVLRVGVNDQLPGFGYIRPDGAFAGFDIDFGRALGAAIFGDATKVQFVSVSASSRFGALSAGEIDVLIRNTTWSLSRDSSLRLTFAVPTFYDGQGVMVRASDGINSLDDLDGAVVCALTGTTTQLNQEDRFAGTGVRYQPLVFDRNETLQEAFIAGRCDAWTSDKSQLAARRAAFPVRAGGPQSLVILPDTLSKEPLAPLVRDDDPAWADLVNWVVLGMLAADELGVTSTNVEQMAESPPSQEVARLLGVPVQGTVFNPGLGVATDFMRAVIRQVGNYDEVYQRNVAPLGIPRAGTLNASWLDGGLMYAPPYR
ncbi:MAG: amino acid ABC transporter substrate-binding protein [Chloroflexi bacterium HGW-Chloroflexi-9]|nr:MAG: amino acid ABC transporter substrate-binding protein [Chloroflexi bacterium HGW-Chloroflexi-9]